MANLLDSSLARKIRMSRRKKNPIEFLGRASLKIDLIDVKYEFYIKAIIGYLSEYYQYSIGVYH